MKPDETKRRIEFGDFQTPTHLANAVCRAVARHGFLPATVVEPTCGRGSFLVAATSAFPGAAVRGYECNPAYVDAARRCVSAHGHANVAQRDFFQCDWDAELEALSAPMLVLGNPPWVSNAAVGSLGGSNLPAKSNVDGLRGIDALTGSANFDISEWMIRENIRWLRRRTGAIAVLCKTSVARKVLAYAWSSGLPISRAAIYDIDSQRDFGVSVDACLLYAGFAPGGQALRCDVYDSLDAVAPHSSFGMRDGVLVSDLQAYERLANLRSAAVSSRWRSGLKHDCRRVFEFFFRDGELTNDFGEKPVIEPEVLFPLLKSSDVAKSRAARKFVLVPHRTMAESPLRLRETAPNAWRYLVSHREAVERRASSIYRKRPPFSIFGVGPYSFAPWKVAIAALYKEIRFEKIGPANGRPVMLDDTCYFLPCKSEAECDLLHRMASSRPAIEFWSSMAFWDAKRPVTAKLLNRLDLGELAKMLCRRGDERAAPLLAKQYAATAWNADQAELFAPPGLVPP